jgi:hypothetical protein
VSHPLDGCRAKIVRAGDHLETLDREARRFVEDHTYRFDLEQDPDTGHILVVVHSTRQPPVQPPSRLSVIVGDVLHNLRSALDHLVWQLAIIGTGPKEPLNQFPIFDTPEKFKEKCERYLHGVRPEHRATIETYQPYHGGNGLALGVIATLNDIDKHRVVHGSSKFGLTGPGTISLTNVRSAQIQLRDITHLDDGAEIYRILSADIIDPKAIVNVQTEVRYSITFGEREGIAASRADLLICRDVVSNIVESFAGEFGETAEPALRPSLIRTERMSG